MFIKKESESKALSNNILSLAQAAKKAKDENNEVINATIGMLYDSNNEFYTFGAVKDIMNEISDYDAFSYSDTDGGELYQSAVLKWLLGEYLTTFTDKYHVGVCATNGGSGAIATTFQNYMERGDSVIVPKVMWETYITLARERGCSHLTYELTDKDQNFNIKSLKESILSNGHLVYSLNKNTLRKEIDKFLKFKSIEEIEIMIESTTNKTIIIVTIAEPIFLITLFKYFPSF